MVSTEYQEKHSASAISGITSRDTDWPIRLPVTWAISRSSSAHWATKQSSARVATERPTITLENQESNRQKRGTSNTGSAER